MVKKMTPDEAIEKVGRERHPTYHYARAVSAENMVYVLHSAACLANDNIMDCTYSKALDRGIETVLADWVFDEPVQVTVRRGRLVPL